MILDKPSSAVRARPVPPGRCRIAAGNAGGAVACSTRGETAPMRAATETMTTGGSMMQSKSRPVARLAVLVLLGLALPAAHADGTRAAIEAVNAAVGAAAAKGDAAAIASYYTADAQLLPAGSEPVKSAAAIQKFWQGALGSGVGAVALKTLEVYGHGSTASEVGQYEMLDKSGKSIDHGKYIVIWRRDGGHWKLHRDIYTTSVAPPKA
jgi:uncharacterized protein (TIGR02246 family)